MGQPPCHLDIGTVCQTVFKELYKMWRNPSHWPPEASKKVIRNNTKLSCFYSLIHKLIPIIVLRSFYGGNLNAIISLYLRIL